MPRECPSLDDGVKDYLRSGIRHIVIRLPGEPVAFVRPNELESREVRTAVKADSSAKIFWIKAGVYTEDSYTVPLEYVGTHLTVLEVGALHEALNTSAEETVGHLEWQTENDELRLLVRFERPIENENSGRFWADDTPTTCHPKVATSSKTFLVLGCI